MGTKGERTREHVLATAESIILQKGYAGTSIEDIISAAGITKGGFFYHFDGKNDLAKGLMLRYLDQDEQFFRSLGDRARTLTEDPLQQLSETGPNPHPINHPCLHSIMSKQCFMNLATFFTAF